MLKRSIWIVVVAVLGLAALWLGGISLINTNSTDLKVQVSGAVDEVRIFRSGDWVNPVAVIQTNGVDTTQVVKLRSAERFSPFYQTAPASYTFTTRQGNQVYQGRKICCETGLFGQEVKLTISGLSEWQMTDQ